MPWIKKEEYDNIPLFYRLEAMPMSKLIDYAWVNYGVAYNAQAHDSKYDLISDILLAIKRDRAQTISEFSNVK